MGRGGAVWFRTALLQTRLRSLLPCDKRATLYWPDSYVIESCGSILLRSWILTPCWRAGCNVKTVPRTGTLETPHGGTHGIGRPHNGSVEPGRTVGWSPLVLQMWATGAGTKGTLATACGSQKETMPSAVPSRALGAKSEFTPAIMVLGSSYRSL